MNYAIRKWILGPVGPQQALPLPADHHLSQRHKFNSATRDPECLADCVLAVMECYLAAGAFWGNWNALDDVPEVRECVKDFGKCHKRCMRT